MAYQRVAFYENGQFLKEIPAGKPPRELPDRAGRPLRLTSLQLYDHAGRAFIEQLFDPGQQPITDVIPVSSPGRAPTVPCHILGWQETVHEQWELRNIRHLAHCCEDGRVILAPGHVAEATFRTARRVRPGTRPFTWVATYDDPSGMPDLYQLDPTTGWESSSERIDRARVRVLALTGPDGNILLEQHCAPGTRLIYRRRVVQPSRGPGPVIVHLLGWQHTACDVTGKAAHIQHMSYIFEPTGTIVMGGRFNPRHAYFHGLEPVPADARLVGEPSPERLYLPMGAGRD